MFSMKLLKYVSFVLLLQACSVPTASKVEKPFKNVFDLKSEIAQWEPGQKLHKTLFKQDTLEKVSIIVENWNNELSAFLDLEWNIPANAERYRVDSVISDMSKIKHYRYSALDENLLVQQVDFYFKNEMCTDAIYVVKEENKAYKTGRVLHLKPQFGYKIEMQQQVRGMMNESFRIEGRFDNAAVLYSAHLLREDGVKLPFQFFKNADATLRFVNANEEIEVKAQAMGDSFLYEMPVFNSRFHLKLQGETIFGRWINNDADPAYDLALVAVPDSSIWNLVSYENVNLSGKWKVQIARNEKVSDAIGVFEQIGNKLFGTFLTQSGDYRALEGRVNGNDFYLAGFDGSHSYYFRGELKANDAISGEWYSGKQFKTTWKAERNADFELPSADTLTYLKPGFNNIDFAFKNLEGELVSLNSPQFENKVRIVTIMGTWCPNCMDEARYLGELYANYKSKGLEIIGLSFERKGDLEADKAVLEKAIRDLDIQYTVLHAGKASSKAAEEALPMLNHVVAFPTSIYVGRDGQVKKIHTGFTGPSTGKVYEDFVRENEKIVRSLLGL
jgi:thiol-disulfide isomerase/thioredoxin